LANLDAMIMLKLNQIQKCRDDTKFPFCFEPFQDSRQTEFGIKFEFSKCAKTLPAKYIIC
jgi:hypothetical protein